MRHNRNKIDLTGIKRICFHDEDNEILYGQDMQFWTGIPTNIWFDIEDSGNHWILRADGYGNHGKYGNGAIHLNKGTEDVKGVEVVKEEVKTEEPVVTISKKFLVARDYHFLACAEYCKLNNLLDSKSRSSLAFVGKGLRYGFGMRKDQTDRAVEAMRQAMAQGFVFEDAKPKWGLLKSNAKIEFEP